VREPERDAAPAPAPASRLPRDPPDPVRLCSPLVAAAADPAPAPSTPASRGPCEPRLAPGEEEARLPLPPTRLPLLPLPRPRPRMRLLRLVAPEPSVCPVPGLVPVLPVRWPVLPVSPPCPGKGPVRRPRCAGLPLAAPAAPERAPASAPAAPGAVSSGELCPITAAVSRARRPSAPVRSGIKSWLLLPVLRLPLAPLEPLATLPAPAGTGPRLLRKGATAAAATRCGADCCGRDGEGAGSRPAGGGAGAGTGGPAEITSACSAAPPPVAGAGAGAAPLSARRPRPAEMADGDRGLAVRALPGCCGEGGAVSLGARRGTRVALCLLGLLRPPALLLTLLWPRRISAPEGEAATAAGAGVDIG
jgi:hypothetical protein